MRTCQCEFYSDGIRLGGILQLPEGATGDGRRAVIVLCSGFQGLKELIPAKLWGPFADAGYACFSFDYRGFGTSEGERGRVQPRAQVEDIQNAVTLLQQQPELYGERIGLVGWGFGGGVVVEVTLQTAEAYYAFRPELMVDRISPRPLLIVHGVRNALHPIDEARSLYAHAREPKELIEIPDGHHLDWIEPGHPLYLATIPRIVNWFRQHLPAGSAPPWHSPRDRSGAPVDSSDS